MGINRIKGSGKDLVEVNANKQLLVNAGDTPAKASYVKLTDGGTNPVDMIEDSLADNYGLTGNSLIVTNLMRAFNGVAGWDRWRNNIEGTILAQAARTASLYSSDQTNYNHKGIYVCMNVTAITGAPSVQMRIVTKDPISGLLTQITQYTTAITAVGRYILALHPGLIDTAGTFHLAADAMLPRTWQLYVKHANADSINYSVSYQLMV